MGCSRNFLKNAISKLLYTYSMYSMVLAGCITFSMSRYPKSVLVYCDKLTDFT